MVLLVELCTVSMAMQRAIKRPLNKRSLYFLHFLYPEKLTKY